MPGSAAHYLCSGGRSIIILSNLAMVSISWRNVESSCGMPFMTLKSGGGGVHFSRKIPGLLP